VTIRTHVSSGTYIRSLVSDMGEVLGTGAYCSQLRRTAISKWSIDDAKTLESYGITN
jgi:Pseudouridine synthase